MSEIIIFTCTIDCTISTVPRFARTVKRAHSVSARSIGVTVVLVGVTLFDVYKK